jgi:Predicted membrane protein (DUF2127)
MFIISRPACLLHFCRKKKGNMETTIKHAYSAGNTNAVAKASLWHRFINWADKQEENRFGWTAFAIAGHGCVFTIITVAVVLLTGNNFIFWPFAIAAMAICLIVNLAAMPTKITIPVLFFSLLLDLAIILLALTNALS